MGSFSIENSMAWGGERHTATVRPDMSPSCSALEGSTVRNRLGSSQLEICKASQDCRYSK